MGDPSAVLIFACAGCARANDSTKITIYFYLGLGVLTKEANNFSQGITAFEVAWF